MPFGRNLVSTNIFDVKLNGLVVNFHFQFSRRFLYIVRFSSSDA